MSLFRRIKNELGDDLLKFAIAKSDNIASLEMYRERSEPTFLFFAVSRQLSAEHYSLGSRPSPFRARFNYAHAENFRSKLELASNVCCMHIIKMHLKRGRPGTEANVTII